MTSRTHRHSQRGNQQGGARPSPSALHRRRHEALERYREGEPIEVICREMGCAKSWVYTWRKRHQCTEPDWVQEHSRRPETTPTKTPDALAAEIVRLRQGLSSDGSSPASAEVIREHLRQHGSDRVPSRRTIYRILSRQAKEVNAHSLRS